MSTDIKFQVRQTPNELAELDEALIKLGYKKSDGTAHRADWFREMRRQTIKEAKKIKPSTT
jgi:hypothetical protein